MKPIIKWAGGKRWLVPILKEVWEPYRNVPLVEPFAGGMAIALGFTPKKALLNDGNPHLINFYQQIQKGLTINMPFLNQADFYYQTRQDFNTLIQNRRHHTSKAAQLFYYLIKTGFNGLCRFNQQGRFNVPFGQHKTILYKTNFCEYQPILKHWTLSNQDFQKISLKGNEFLYVDPPYDVEFTQYYDQSFHWQDQERLAAWLALQKNPMAISNQGTQRILTLYKKLGFTLFTLHAPRSIACNGNRKPTLEMLALKGIPRQHYHVLKPFHYTF